MIAGSQSGTLIEAGGLSQKNISAGKLRTHVSKRDVGHPGNDFAATVL